MNINTASTSSLCTVYADVILRLVILLYDLVSRNRCNACFADTLFIVDLVISVYNQTDCDFFLLGMCVCFSMRMHDLTQVLDVMIQ